MARGTRQRNPTDADAAHWDNLRQQAEAALQEARESGPDPDDDLMGAIAYRAPFPELEPFDDELRGWINRAQGELRVTFRELAAAMTGDPEAHARVQSRQYFRNQRAAGKG